MTSENFSWGIVGFIITILASIAGMIALAVVGYTDPVVFAGLSLLASNALVGLSAVMNPSRGFQNEMQNLTSATENMQQQAQKAERAVQDVKRVLK
jgi:hypothetical protein